MNCPGCNTPLEEAPTVAGVRQHLRCPGCNLVYVPHEGCKNKHDRGLHLCDRPEDHVKVKAASA